MPIDRETIDVFWTGLGLVISLRLAEAMGGTLELESEGVVGRGTTFRLVLPLAAAPEGAPERAAATAPEGAPTLEARRVLVVGDRGPTVAVLRSHLAGSGAEVAAVGSTGEAIERLGRGGVGDIVVVDLSSLDPKQRELAEDLRRLRAAAPVVVLTILGRRALEVEELGVAAYLTKPLKRGPLREALASALGARVSPAATVASEGLLDATFASRVPLRILLAEDNATNQKMQRLILERLGYSIDLVANGVEAIDALGRRAYDVVLMDVRMPDMDGLEATRRIRAEVSAARQPRIVALTADASADDRRACIDAGMDDYLAKPMSIDGLRAALERCLAPVA